MVVIIVEVPLFVEHMTIFKIVVVEVFVELVVAHVVVATFLVGIQFFVPIVVNIPTIFLISLISLQTPLIFVGIFVDISHACQVDCDYVVY